MDVRISAELSISQSEVGFYWRVQNAGSGGETLGSGSATTFDAALKATMECVAVAWAWKQKESKELT
jgi:hypothetical protein